MIEFKVTYRKEVLFNESNEEGFMFASFGMYDFAYDGSWRVC